MVAKELLEFLRCPACLSVLVERDGKLCCEGKQCGLKFPISAEGIVSLLANEAEGSAEALAQLEHNPMALRPKR